ncbi:MAG: B12-binding domain-containing radical SAM protein [Planctomycetota bacterium]
MGLPLGLLTLAAILPQEWHFQLADLNTKKLRDRDIQRADVICVGGMTAQQDGILDIIRKARKYGKFVVVGGTDPTSQPTIYQDANALVLGEAETNVPLWLKAWEQGSPEGVFQGGGAPDLTGSPIPRYDLARLKDYLYVSTQSSRGCPYHCEFCTVTELFGRMPRTKTPEQVCRELDALFDLGYRGWVDFVDDNFIGNKTSVKRLLPVLVDWCKRRNYPFFFSTEVSLNLAEEPELMDQMAAVDFRYVFTGVESSDEKVLLATQKPINTHRPIQQRIQRIQEHGLLVTAGFVLGFDNEAENAADSILACAKENALPVAMVSLLTAAPLAQLTRRLAAEGRLMDLAGNLIGLDQTFEMRTAQCADSIMDQTASGLNFTTTRDRKTILKDQIRIIDTLYDPENFMARAAEAVARIPHVPKHKPGWVESWADLKGFVRLAVTMSLQPDVRRHFWRFLGQSWKLGPNSFALAAAIATIYLHFMEMRTRLVESLQRRYDGEPVSQLLAVNDAQKNEDLTLEIGTRC